MLFIAVFAKERAEITPLVASNSKLPVPAPVTVGQSMP